jgi:hypothetical protein
MSIMKKFIFIFAVWLFVAGSVGLAVSDGAVYVGDCSIYPPIVSDDFVIDVITNKDVFGDRDILRLAVNLRNNSDDPVWIGVCPITIADEDPELQEGEIVEVDQGCIDDVDVDVVVIPKRPRIIGYGTLTRIGPSPVPMPSLEALTDVVQCVCKPLKFRLPLFDGPYVAGHSSEIISTANVLIRGPYLKITDADIDKAPATNATADEIDLVPVIARYIPCRPGYYLLDCRVTRICGVREASAQKIIKIKRKYWPVAVVEAEAIAVDAVAR